MQVRLLRVLQDGEVRPVGAGRTVHVDTHVIAATNVDLERAVAEQRFRQDLFYRLSVIVIALPPLRDRREDIPILVRHFIKDYSKQHDRAFHGISAAAMQILVEYPWPGNVRELRNLIESMVVLSPGHEIQPEDLPRQIREGGSARYLPVHVGPILRGEDSAAGRELEFILRSLLELKLQVEELRRRVGDGGGATVGNGAGGDSRWIGDVEPAVALGPGYNPPVVRAIEPRDQAPPPNVVTVAPGMKMAEIERAVIEAALKETRGNRRRAADMLGIGERTLYRKIKEYRMPEEGYGSE